MNLMNTKPPYFYHPLRVAFLDDNQAFLDALELEFVDKFNRLTFTDPSQAFETITKFFNNNPNSHLTLQKNAETDTANMGFFCLDFSRMLDLLYSQRRFEQIAILIVDYEMPSINGLEFCLKFRDTNIFKIMLTAAADKDTAISAFNDGLIDRFILKTSKNFHSEILLAVNELTKRYFLNLSASLTGYNKSISALYDNKLYQKLFLHTFKKSKAVEYYLIDNSGSLLFLDKDANPTWLLIKNSQELGEQLSLLDGYDFPVEIMTALANKEKMLFLFSESDYQKPIIEWIKNVWNSQQLDGDYYYSIVTEKKIMGSIDWDRIITYDNYKNQTHALMC